MTAADGNECVSCFNPSEGHSEWCPWHPDQVREREFALSAVAEWLLVAALALPRRTHLVWRREDAPSVLTDDRIGDLSDCSWISLHPPDDQDYVSWAGDQSFGCFEIRQFRLPNGWQVRYGFHG